MTTLNELLEGINEINFGNENESRPFEQTWLLGPPDPKNDLPTIDPMTVVPVGCTTSRCWIETFISNIEPYFNCKIYCTFLRAMLYHDIPKEEFFDICRIKPKIGLVRMNLYTVMTKFGDKSPDEHNIKLIIGEIKEQLELKHMRQEEQRKFEEKRPKNDIYAGPPVYWSADENSTLPFANYLRLPYSQPEDMRAQLVNFILDDELKRPEEKSQNIIDVIEQSAISDRQSSNEENWKIL
ncbi:hypothetical protein SNEBB_005378 [Seison nebaliae]|nr:hypothetical protein SNEBB_005378 [Seison nebaliae]